MTIAALFVEWLPDGRLPIYDLGPHTIYWQFREDRTWDMIQTGRRRMMVSLEIDFLGVDFGSAFEEILEPLAACEENGALVFAVRTCCELNGTRYLCAGMTFVPGAFASAVPLEGANPATLIAQFCNGITAQNSDALHPALRAMFELELVRRAEREVERRQTAEAEARARVLLEAHLSPDQAAEFRDQGVFHVRLGDGRLFRFSKRFGHNVHLIENGACAIEYCIIAVEQIPLYDQMLAQKVLLEVLPDEFFRLANFRHIAPTSAPVPLHAELANLLAQE